MSLAQPKLLKIANRLGRVLDLGGSHRPGWRHCFTEAARLSQKLCASLPLGLNWKLESDAISLVY